MWMLIVIVILMLILFRSSIAHKITDKYAENLMKDPKFLSEVNKVNEAYAKQEAKVVAAMEDLMRTDEYQRIQMVIDEVQDVRKGLALYSLIYGISDKYNVDWPTAIETVRVGLNSGKMKLDPDSCIDKYRLVESFFAVNPKA